MRPFLAMIVLTALAAISGCGTPRPPKYYQIEPPAAATATAQAYPVSLVVGRISAPHLLRDDRIVYRTGAQELDTYEYHRWAEPPTDMVQDMLVLQLRNSGKYRAVEKVAGNARGDYIVRGRLVSFEEVDAAAITARVALTLELFQPKTGTTVWSQSYAHDEPVKEKKVPAVVEALDRNLKAGLEQLTDGINSYFASHPTP